MLRFIAKRSPTGKLVLGLVLLPADLARLLAGNPEFTMLADVGAENPVVESVGVYSFRDLEEFRDAMREAGVDPRMIATSHNEFGALEKFMSTPKNKVRSN